MKKLHNPKPKRLQEELTLENVSKHRKFNCIFYEFCLDHAVDFVYPAFSCLGCTYYYKGEMNKIEKEKFEEMAKFILNQKGK